MKVTKQPTTKATPTELVALVDSLRGQVATLENTLQSSDGTRELLENIQDGILVIDAATHRIREINPMAATMFGAPRDKIMGHECFEFICPAERGACPVTDLGVAVDHAERQMVTRGGGRKPILKTVARMTLGGDDVLVESFMDIGEQKRIEEELRALALRHDALLAAIPEIVMEVDNHKLYTWANQAGKEFFGEDVVGKEAASFFEGEQQTYETVAPVFKGNEGTVYVESWQRRRDGERRLLAWWCRTLKDESGNVTGALSSAHDITERKAAEEALAASEERYRTLTELSQDMIFIIDRDDCVEYVNAAAAAALGRRADEAVGKPRCELFHPDVAEAQGAALRHVFETGEPSVSQVDRVFPQGQVCLEQLTDAYPERGRGSDGRLSCQPRPHRAQAGRGEPGVRCERVAADLRRHARLGGPAQREG